MIFYTNLFAAIKKNQPIQCHFTVFQLCAIEHPQVWKLNVQLC